MSVEQRLERLENIALAAVAGSGDAYDRMIGHTKIARALVYRYDLSFNFIEVFARYRVTSLPEIDAIPDRSLRMARGIGKKGVEKLRARLAVLRMCGEANQCHENWHYFEDGLETCQCRELWPVAGE